MEKSFEELEDILPESSTQLVSLNTRVPRFVSKMIDESVGILQLASRYQKVSKQVAIQILIERGYQAIREEFESMDYADNEVAATVEIIGEEVASIKREVEPRTPYNVKAYAEMSNKSKYEPRIPSANKANSESVTRLQRNLGLK